MPANMKKGKLNDSGNDSPTKNYMGTTLMRLGGKIDESFF